MKYCICIDIFENNFIFSVHTHEEEANLIAPKVFEMASPPQVFSVNEFIRVCEFLNCERTDDSWMEHSNLFESNGIVSVGVVKEGKVKRLI